MTSFGKTYFNPDALLQTHFIAFVKYQDECDMLHSGDAPWPPPTPYRFLSFPPALLLQ